ncbi:MAG: ABC transporter substrate-binding protein [Burkholderiales bacterium]
MGRAKRACPIRVGARDRQPPASNKLARDEGRIMKRRAWIGIGFSGLLARPLTAAAQQAGKLARIGFLSNLNPELLAASVEGFRQGMRELGWVEGQNVEVEYRWADGNLDRHPALAAELVKLPVDVIVTAGPQAVLAARQASSTIPIVVALMPDPVALGVAASLARPGGNVTGMTNVFEELTPKQLQIFKETMPRAKRIDMLSDPSLSTGVQAATEAAARELGLKAQVFQIHDVAEIDAALQEAKTERADGVHVLPSPFFNRQRRHIAELAARLGLPTISEAREYVQDGGLMSYGPSFPGMYHRAASYVDRILKGAKPGDLPIEQPTKFELVVNVRVAKALGITIPRGVLLRADEVIE